MYRLIVTALAITSLAFGMAGSAQQNTWETAPRSKILSIALPYEPNRITGGFGYNAEVKQMAKGVAYWELGKCTRYELLYWTTQLKVKPREAYAGFLKAVRAAGWVSKSIFSFDPIEAIVLSKGARRVLGSLDLDSGPRLSLCELTAR